MSATGSNRTRSWRGSIRRTNSIRCVPHRRAWRRPRHNSRNPRASSSASDFCWRGTSIPAPSSSGRSRRWRPRGRNSKPPRPAGVVGPGFNDEFGDTFGTIYGFTADGFTQRELRDYVENIRRRLLRIADVSSIDILGAQDEKIPIEFSTEKLAGLGIDRADLVAALRA